MMVRMRQMHRVTDVELNQSSTELGREGDVTVDSCGRYYQFNLTVTFSAAPIRPRPRAASHPVPASPRRWIVTLTDRDRKIALAIVPILLLAVYWFLLMAPKREEAAKAAKELTEQTERRDNARAKAQASEGAETNFAADYGEIVRLGKAIPSGSTCRA